MSTPLLRGLALEQPTQCPNLLERGSLGFHRAHRKGVHWYCHACEEGGKFPQPSYVYVASSWRNPMHAGVCAALSSAGISHYDFKNPPGGTGFSWRDVEPPCETCGGTTVIRRTGHLLPEIIGDCPDCTYRGVAAKGTDHVPKETYLKMLDHPVAQLGFASDMDALNRADAVVLVLPCGKSAHLELGQAVGAGKRTAILMEEPMEPELMYRMVDYVAPSLWDLLGWLGVED